MKNMKYIFAPVKKEFMTQWIPTCIGMTVIFNVAHIKVPLHWRGVRRTGWLEK